MKWFEKTFLGFLYMCLIIGVIVTGCVAAAETCEHKNTITASSNGMITGFDYYGHLFVDGSETWCSDCNTLLDSDVKKVIQEHSFDASDKCTACGYQKAGIGCVHRADQTYTEEIGIDSVEPYDSSKHVYIAHVKTICRRCGWERIHDEARYSEHNFGSNNKCTSCGYQKSTVCAHANTETKTEKTEYEPISGNEKQHRVIRHNKVSCSTCGKVLKENEVEYWVGSHSFNSNGYCSSCGYEKADCVHANTSKKYVTDAEYINVDAEQHYKIRYYNLVCSKCKKVVDENVRGEELQKHSLDNLGACRYCEYSDIGKCKHWHTTDTVIVKQNYKKRDQREHKVEGLGTVTCDDCHVVIEENAEVYNYEYHNFDRNAVCLYCGYQIKIDEDRGLSVRSTHTFYVPKEGESHTYRMGGFQSFEWTVHSTVDWISLSTNGGKHGDSFTYTVAANMGEDRCGNIIIEDKYAGVVTIFIIQAGESEQSYLTVDRGHISGLVADVTGGQGATINVSSNVAWQASEGLDWVSLSTTSGNGNGSFTVYVDANTGYAREGVITVYGAPCEAISIRIAQEGAIVDPATCEHDYGYDYADVSNGEWQSINDDYHKRVTVLYKDVCTLCGDVRYQRRADEAAVQEKHTWGKTKWKEYKKRNEGEHYRTGMTSCTALGCNATKNVVETGMHEYKDTIRAEKHIYIDESYHQLVTTYYKQCDCGATISSEVPSEYLAAHVYNGDTGECLAVGCTSVLKDDPTEMCEHRWGASWVCSKCNLRKENAEELWEMQKQLTEAITQPYYSDRLNAEGDNDAVSGFELAVMELLAKGFVGTAEHEIEQGIRNSDTGIDNGRDIVHKMVYDEVFKIEKKWNTFVKEMSSLSNGIREDFTTEKAQAIYLLSQIDDSEYIILLDGDQNDWAKNPKLKSLWMLLGDEALRDYSQMDEYRRSAKSLGAQSLNVLSEAGKWASKIGKGINLMNTGANYILEYLYKDELNATIDKWIAATDDENFKAEMEDYKDVYNSEVGVIISTFTDSGFASSELKDIGTLMAKKGLFGAGVKNVVGKLGNSAFAKVVSQADTVLMANQLLYKYIIGIDIDSMYTSISNLQTVDDLYRDQVETIEAFSRSGASYADYENELRLAAALSKLECQYYLAILNNNMLGLSEEEKSQMVEIRDDYEHYITAIDTYLEEYLDALQDARDTSLFIH